MPNLYIIAGPNGAGKTTASKVLLPEVLHCREFVNADEIARGLSPFNPASADLQAGKVMLTRIRQLAEEGADFAFETTLSSRVFAGWIPEWKAKGYNIHLLYLWLASPDLAIRRVQQRALEGGHLIPEATIQRRYHAGLRNLFELYLPLVNCCRIYDNSQKEPLAVATIEDGEKTIHDSATWEKIYGYK